MNEIHMLGIILGIPLIILFLRDFGILKPKSKLEKRNYEVIDKELHLYKREKLADINKDIQSRIETNWKIVDDARNKANFEKDKINKEISLLEATKNHLESEINKEKEIIVKERELFKKLIEAKNSEIERLVKLVDKTIDNSKPITNIQNK